MKVLDLIRRERWLPSSKEIAVGVEVELEGCNYPLGGDRTRTVGPYPLEYNIDAHRDGSLRNGGIELVTKPIRGKEIRENVEYICKLANLAGWQPSNRAGIHIHVDVQRLALSKLMDFLKIYTLVEPALFNFASDGRENSIYCKAWNDVDTTSVRGFVEETAYIEQATGGAWSPLSTRYLGLNLDSCRKYGTLEFRHLRSTVDPERIMRWIELLLQMREYAVTEDITQALVNKLTPTSVLATIFGDLRLYYPEYDSYFYQRALPLCNDLFWPVQKQVQWTNGPVKKKASHPGFQKFSKRALESKVEVPLSPEYDPAFIERYLQVPRRTAPQRLRNRVAIPQPPQMQEAPPRRIEGIHYFGDPDPQYANINNFFTIIDDVGS